MKLKATIAAIAVAVAMSSFWASQSEAESQSASSVGANLPQVRVVTPTVKKVTEWDHYTGRFEAMDTVELRARVSGHLTQVHFKDGEFVEQGDVLFTIDQRPFTARLAIAKGGLAEAQANLSLAETNLLRIRQLRQQKAVSQANMDQALANFQTAKAALTSAFARVEQAELDLKFTEIRAPISGRVDRHLLDIGNLINANDTLLTNIVSVDPIFITFDVDQNAYLKYTRYDQNGTRVSSRKRANPVLVAVGDNEDFSWQGKMDYVSNQIDGGTGTIRARALVHNSDGFLTPGLFARVKLLSRETQTAILIPDSAIVAQNADKVVYLVNEDNQVQAVKVETGPLVDGLRLVRTGLTKDSQIIVGGLSRVQAGQLVAAKNSGEAKSYREAQS